MGDKDVCDLVMQELLNGGVMVGPQPAKVLLERAQRAELESARQKARADALARVARHMARNMSWMNLEETQTAFWLERNYMPLEPGDTPEADPRFRPHPRRAQSDRLLCGISNAMLLLGKARELLETTEDDHHASA